MISDLEGYDLKIGDEEIGGRDLWVDFTEWVRNVKIFVPYVNAHQSVTSEEDDFNDQVNTVACSACQSAFFSPTGQWAHEQRGNAGRNGGYVWA